MINNIKIKKHNKLIAFVLILAVIFSFCVSFSGQLAFAKTDGSDTVNRVFFYASDKSGADVYIASAAMDELKAKSHGNTQTGKNYYATLIDQLPTVNYLEGKGLSFDEFVKLMADKSNAEGSGSLAFNAQNSDKDKLVFYGNDSLGIGKNYTAKDLCKTTRYYFPTLMENFVPEDMAVNNRQAVISAGVEMPAYLAVESYGDRIGNLQTEIAANGGALTGCLQNKIDAENALRLIKPMTVSELGDEDTQAIPTAAGSTKWIYNVALKYADNTDSPITSQGSVAEPQCKMLLDNNNTLKVTFSCATPGAEIYHSLQVDGDEVYAGKVPQYKYDGRAVEIKNFDPTKDIIINYMAVKEGYSDAGVQKIKSDQYTTETNPDESNFTYTLKSDKSQVNVNDKVNLKAALQTDKNADVYGMEYQVAIPAAKFAVTDVKPVAGWQYKNVRVGNNQVLTFINMQKDDVTPVSATKLIAGKALDIADITVKAIAPGSWDIAPQDMAVTKEDGSKYSNVKGEKLTVTVKSQAVSTDNKVWNGKEDHSWYNRTDSVFHISTAEQLAGLAYIVNQGNKLQLPGESAPQRETFTDKTIYLDNDVYLNKQKYVSQNNSALQWSAIAGGVSVDNDAVFDGTFDGQGYTVHNMYIYSPNTSGDPKDSAINNLGLFGITAEKAVIKNVTVQDGYIESGRQLGAIVGKTGCLQANSFDASRADGHGTLIINCNNRNSIIKGSDGKGIGGIVGAAWNHAIVESCNNSGSVINTGGFEAGGIAGTCEGTVTRCTNSGEISGGNAGGIVGKMQDGGAVVEYCSNTGDVSGNCAGGIVAYVQSGSTNGNINTGKVTGNTAGAVIADLKGSQTHSNNYYLEGTAPAGIGNGSASGLNSAVSKTADEMKSADFINGLGGDFTQGSDGLPVLLTYHIAAKASVSQVVPDGTFEIRVYAYSNSKNDIDFTGAAAAVQYNQSLVSVEEIIKADGVNCEDNNGVLTITADSSNKSMTSDGCTLVTLKCKALGNGQAYFTVSNAKITVAGAEKAASGENAVVTIKNNSAGGGGGGGAVVTPVTPDKPDVTTGKFSDVADSHWAAAYINKMAEQGIINGKTANSFAPNDAITRAEFAAILSRMSGEELPAADNTFTDVNANAWYAGNVAWAVKAGITNGMTASTFAPEAKISRQEMAVMIMRYAEHKEKTLAENTQPVTFADNAAIASYAKDAVSAMQKAGIISGKENNMFAPAANATRAEAAKMLGMLLEQLN